MLENRIYNIGCPSLHKLLRSIAEDMHGTNK